MTLSNADQNLLQRYRDNEMDQAERTTFQTRLDGEPELRLGLTDLEELGAGFAAGRAAAFAAPAGFTTALLAEVRQLPNRIQLQQAEISAAAIVLSRTLLIAALVLFGLGLCWHAGLFDAGGPALIEAAPDEIEREMERLDAIINGWSGK